MNCPYLPSFRRRVFLSGLLVGFLTPMSIHSALHGKWAQAVIGMLFALANLATAWAVDPSDP